ncbi:unnamed protein product [Amoebophrya sp. A25]|nr:unnamed protein product [Amoebophrya sp. A25]|eukprot:GSA25T00027568001.1
MRNEPRRASVLAAEDNTKILALSKEAFETVLGPLLDLVSDIGFLSRKKINRQSKKEENVELEELQRVGLLGCGGFGAVTLEQHKKTHKTYALKALSKGYVVKMKMQKGAARKGDPFDLHFAVYHPIACDLQDNRVSLLPSRACTWWRAFCGLPQVPVSW